MTIDTVSEWLRRWTRNPLGSARRGSNPLGVVLSLLFYDQATTRVVEDVESESTRFSWHVLEFPWVLCCVCTVGLYEHPRTMSLGYTLLPPDPRFLTPDPASLSQY